MPCIEARALAKSLGGKRVVNNVSLSVECGRVAAILGPNGSGKSTLLQLLAGVLRPDSGRALILGREASDPGVRRLLGYLPQEEPLYPTLTGWENIRVLAWMKGVRPDLELAAKLAKELGVYEALGKRVGTYSGGMQRKLSLIAVLSTRPRVLLLDEPTSGLDPASRREVVEMLREYARSENAAVLYSTHIGSDAEHADEVGFMRSGVMVAWGAPQELIERYVRGFYVEMIVQDAEGLLDELRRAGYEARLEHGKVRVHAATAEELAEIARIAARRGLRALEARRPGIEDAYLVATGVPLGGGA